MKSIKKVLCLALALAVSFALVACGGGGADPSGVTPSGGGLRVGIVTSSGVDDGSFGEACYNGILAFSKNNPEATYNDVKESDVGKVVQAVENVIGDYDVIVCPGFQFAPVGAIAELNPTKNIILVDAAPTNSEGETVTLDNVYSMQFREQESGFLAGVAAALQTKTGKVAVVNGIAFPSNVNYQLGFMSGVNYANAKLGTKAEIVELASYAGTDVKGNNVGGNYIGAFADQATGKLVGQELIKKGVDIMLVAAGDSGNGVFAAAKEAQGEVFVIGCDIDQYDDGVAGDRNIVLTSVVKRMAINVERQLEAMAAGTFKGENALLGADTDSTGYISDKGRHQLSDETVKILDEMFELLKNGTVVPASSSENTPTDFPGLK